MGPLRSRRLQPLGRKQFKKKDLGHVHVSLAVQARLGRIGFKGSIGVLLGFPGVHRGSTGVPEGIYRGFYRGFRVLGL